MALDAREREWEYVASFPDHLKCALCRKPLQEPVQSSCGERWHTGCLKQAVKLSDDPTCPVCGEKLDPKLCWRDVFADKELAELKIFCIHKANGCTWRGCQKHIQAHLESCEFAEVICANKKCQEKVLRHQLDRHTSKCVYRPVNCSYCNSQVALIDQEAHNTECMRMPVECPNDCEKGFTIERENLPTHLEECPNRKTDCPIAGCQTKIHHSEVDKHLACSVTSHIALVNDNIITTERSLATIQSSIDKNEERLKSCQREVHLLGQQMETLDHHLADAVAQQKIMQQKTLEACYQTVDNLQKEIHSSNSRMEQFMRMMTEKMIKLEETVTLQSMRIHQLEERQIENRPANDNTRDMIAAQDRVLATHDVKLAEHGLRLDMMDCKNTEGVLLWKITEIRRRRREAVSSKTPSIYSQPFYSSSCGYKMCARMYLNGDGMGRGSHLSLFFVIMRGEYDSLLPWPFSHKVTLVLIDQVHQRHISDTFRPDPKSSSFARPQNEMNVASGCPLFVSLATVDGGSYIHDDTMYIKIIIDPTNLYKPDSR